MSNGKYLDPVPAEAEADAQADATLAQVAAEEKAAAAAAELLRAQAVKAFNDAISAVKTQDLEAERLEGPFDDTKHTLADLKLRFPIGAKVRCNAQCPSWQPQPLDAYDLYQNVKRSKDFKHLEAEFINIQGRITIQDGKFDKSWNRQPIPPGQFGIVEDYYQNHAVKVHDPSFDFHDYFKRSIDRSCSTASTWSSSLLKPKPAPKSSVRSEARPQLHLRRFLQDALRRSKSRRVRF